MGKYFGTDGFRAEAGVGLTSYHAYEIGRYLAWYYKREKRGGSVSCLVGKDTRLSSYMLEYAIASGLASGGADVYMTHVTTTPGVSFSTRTEGLDFGIMISASHNPFYDNGIKIVGAHGEKLDEKITDKIEEHLLGIEEKGQKSTLPFEKGSKIGRIVDYYGARNRYIGYLISLSHHSFKSLRIGLDLANGSTFMIAKRVFEALGARVYAINDDPNGTNVNVRCGSTCPDSLCALVKEKGLDVGFAFDGDGDRCIAVDETGEVQNGDKILYLLARELKREGELAKDKIVCTVMSNMGLDNALEGVGIGVERTRVGDRFVHEKMQNEGYSLGGEESGHIILSKYATTGDGILTAIKVCEAMLSQKSTLGALCRDVRTLPQKSVSIPVKDKKRVMSNPLLENEVNEIKRELSKNGRVLLRESGTEPVIRIMVEAMGEGECEKYVERISSLIYAQGLNL